MTTEKIVESFIDTLDRNQEFVTNIRTSGLSRLVWLVAIAGFVIVNAKPYWEAVRGTLLTSHQILLLSSPWVVTALIGIITHILFDEVAVKDYNYYSTKKSALDLHRIDTSVGKIDPAEFSAILRDTDPTMKPLKDAVDKWANLAQWSERLTYVMIGIAFLSLGFAAIIP